PPDQLHQPQVGAAARRALRAVDPVADDPSPVSRAWRAGPDARRARRRILAPQGPRLTAARPLLRPGPASEHAGRVARSLHHRDRDAEEELPYARRGASAGATSRHLSDAGPRRDLARLVRPPPRSPPLHASARRLERAGPGAVNA